MKHLKKFNENISSYEEVSDRGFEEFMSDGIPEMISIGRVISELKKHLSDINLHIRKIDNTSIGIDSDSGHIDCFITDMDDEYFMIRILDRRDDQARFFKCDQIEGLVSCIRDDMKNHQW